MKSAMILAAAAAVALGGGPALSSSCSERIAELEAELGEAAESAIATSSGGQGVAGARESQARHAENQDVPVEEPAVPYQEEEEEEEAVERAEEAGGGGDRIMQAKAMLNEARQHDEDGDAAACDEAVRQAAMHLDGD